MINVLICGIGGKMGMTVFNLLQNEKQARAVCGVDISAPENAKIPVYKSFDEVKESVDVIIDFSSPNIIESELKWAQKTGVAVVLGTTGFGDDRLKLIDDSAKKIAIFKSANFSLGISLLKKLVREAANVLGERFDIEIIEKHHNQKLDAPSGTALALAESANVAGSKLVFGRSGSGKREKEIGVHAVRGGTVVGEHEVCFFGADEVITLSHSASSKAIFASGAIKAAIFIAGKAAGKYDMCDLIC